MVSSYLGKPIRTLEQALEDRAWVKGAFRKLGPGAPTDPAVDRHEPIRMLNRLVENELGTAADDSSFARRPPDIPADRSAEMDSDQGTSERAAEIPPQKKAAVKPSNEAKARE